MIIPFNNKRKGKEKGSTDDNTQVRLFMESIDLEDFIKSYSEWLKTNVDEKIKLENKLNKTRFKNIRKGD